MRGLANEFSERVMIGTYGLNCAFATLPPIPTAVASTFTDLQSVPGLAIATSLDIMGPERLEAQYRKVMLEEYGPPTNVQLSGHSNQMHRPDSVEPVIYLTIPASEYVNACKRHGMELFRYNPRLYLGSNKVNTGAVKRAVALAPEATVASRQLAALAVAPEQFRTTVGALRDAVCQGSRRQTRAGC